MSNARDKIADILDRDRKWPDANESADAILAAMPDILAGMVKDLVFEERRNNYWGHKSHSYQVAWNEGQCWRVRLNGRVICRTIKGHQNAVLWANAHHRKQIMESLNLGVDGGDTSG